MSASEVSEEHQELLLDGTKINWHLERVAQWERGERFAPITIDMALTRACNASCSFCYAMLQENERSVITKEHIQNFMKDCAEVGVKAVSLVSDGESTLSPIFLDAIDAGFEAGLSMAVGTNGTLLNEAKLRHILPKLTYLRYNFSGGEKERYTQIMGLKGAHFDKVCENVRISARVKKELGLNVTVGLQMVLMPQDADQILPMAKIGKELGADYTIIKHCSDDEYGSLGVKYEKYKDVYPLLKAAEAFSDPEYKVVVKWNKIKMEGKRSYERCYGAPFLLQMSGSGLIAPCGMLFGSRYKKFHVANIAKGDRFKDVVFSDRYWEVMNYLASDDFNAKTMCGSLCLQDRVNTALDNYKKGKLPLADPKGKKPMHINFI